MFELFDTVRVVTASNKLVKEGIIVKMTSRGARVYQAKCEWPFTDSMEFAEWFPFSSAEIKIMPTKAKRRQEV